MEKNYESKKQTEKFKNIILKKNFNYDAMVKLIEKFKRHKNEVEFLKLFIVYERIFKYCYF